MLKCLQVHQTKKSNKFTCKICGDKQTVKRHYGLGNGKECRIHVQKLNGVRGEIDELNEVTPTDTDSDEETEPTQVIKPNIKINKSKFKSKWSNFVDKEKEDNEPNPEVPMFLGNTEVVLEVPTKRKKFVKVKSATKAKPKDNPWNKTPVMQDNIIPFTDNFFSESKDLEIIEVNVENKPDRVDTPLIDKFSAKENVKPIKINQQSKWAQFSEHKDDENQFQNATIKYADNISSVKSNREQFTEENAFNDKEALKVKKGSQNNETQGPISIFCMSDEIDLDSILDI